MSVWYNISHNNSSKKGSALKSSNTSLLILLLLSAVVPLPALCGLCAKCQGVAPAGWNLCQRCKNEAERLEREEARKKRAEARRQKEAAEKEAKLKKLIDEQTRPPSAAPDAGAEAQPTSAVPATAVSSNATGSAVTTPAAPAQPAAKPKSDAFSGLFGVKFGQKPGAAFAPKTVQEEGRFVERLFYSPAKNFRGFSEYSVRSSEKDGIYEIKAHLRFTASATVDAKLAANTEYDDCVALLAKKFKCKMTPDEESLNARSARMGFTTPEGIESRTLTIRVERDLEAARVAAASPAAAADPSVLERAMDAAWDVWITATDNLSLLRDQRLQEAEDLDAL